LANRTGRGHDSKIRKLKTILRWAFLTAMSSLAVVFVALAVCMVRQHFASDDFQIYRWNPSTRGYTEIVLGWRGHSFFVHSESTTALASDNTSVIEG